MWLIVILSIEPNFAWLVIMATQNLNTKQLDRVTTKCSFKVRKHRICNGVNARLEKGYILFTKNLLHGGIWCKVLNVDDALLKASCFDLLHSTPRFRSPPIRPWQTLMPFLLFSLRFKLYILSYHVFRKNICVTK